MKKSVMMTRIRCILFLGCFMIFSPVFAQNDVSFVKEGKKWVCKSYEGSTRYDYHYMLSGDTLIDGNSYKVLWAMNEKYYGDKELHHVACIREENKKVYMIKDDAAEYMLYDFNLDYNEEFTTPLLWDENWGEKMQYVRFLKEYDTIYTQGTTRRWMGLVGGLKHENGEIDWTTREYFWVEGIGCDGDTFGLFSGEMDACYEDGELVFTNRNFWYPETARLEQNESLSIFLWEKTTIYDLSGRRVNNGELPKGVYIQNGKKFVVK